MMESCRLPEKDTLKELMAGSELPVLPPDTPHLLRAMSSEEMDFRELAAVVERFPTIAAKLISLANSPWSAPVTEVTSVEMACARLGFAVVRSVAVALGIANIFNPRLCPAFDPVRYWSDAFLTAELSSLIADGLEEDEPDAASLRTAGLLHNLGLLWLATWMPGQTDQALRQAEDEPDTNLDLLLESHCGSGYVEAGALLADAWHFPDLLVTAIACQSSPDYRGTHWRAAAVVGIARRLRHEETAVRERPDSRFAALGLDDDTRRHLADEAAARRAHVQELARTLFSS